jgi:hypothetical protein
VWLNLAMPGKKSRKKKTFSATKAVKTMSRAAIGTVPAVKRVEDDRRKSTEKHKRPLEKVIAEEE